MPHLAVPLQVAVAQARHVVALEHVVLAAVELVVVAHGQQAGLLPALPLHDLALDGAHQLVAELVRETLRVAFHLGAPVLQGLALVRRECGEALVELLFREKLGAAGGEIAADPEELLDLGEGHLVDVVFGQVVEGARAIASGGG